MTTIPDLIHRLRTRAQIRRQITTRKSVQEGKPDRIADLLEEAATVIEQLGEQLVFNARVAREQNAELVEHLNALRARIKELGG